MADAEENVVTEAEGEKEPEEKNETTKDTEENNLQEEKFEDANKSKMESKSSTPKPTRATTANVSSRAKEQDSVVQPLLTGNLKNIIYFEYLV